MNRFLLFLLLIGMKAFPEVPESAREEYAVKLHQAFVLQCEGKSTQAFYSFQNGFQQGIKAGESSAKLQVVADLFYWYRRYGNHLKLFAKIPTGDNVITDEYKGKNCTRHRSCKAIQPGGSNRYSEFGNDPQQARKVQDFMFGVGELISGIFLISVCPESFLFIGGGAGLVTHGFYTIKDSLHDLWTQHEIELFELQKLSERANQASK